eukprot:7317921-Lingulodinium_polyedra.AAC.1
MFISGLEMGIWCRLAIVIEVPGYTGKDCKNDVMNCCHTQRAFMELRFLREARGYPWCLAKGDIEGNLRRLADMNDVDLDPGCIAKIKLLMDKRLQQGSLCQS